jgi:hypothetical protein
MDDARESLLRSRWNLVIVSVAWCRRSSRLLPPGRAAGPLGKLGAGPVYHCAITPEVHVVRNPAQLEWAEVMQVAHYRVNAGIIRRAAGDEGDPK